MKSILPLLAIGAFIFAVTKQETKKALEKVSVSFGKIKWGWPIKLTLKIENPTALKVEITFIRGSIKYKGTEVAKFRKTDSQIMNPGTNEVTLEISPSVEALALLKKSEKQAPRVISINWEVGTSLYSITGEKSTTI
jgi:hypothetical protein